MFPISFILWRHVIRM